MEVLVETTVVEQCKEQEILLAYSVDESKVQDSLIDDWSKKVISETETTERNQRLNEMISLLINQKIEQRKRKQFNQLSVFELFIVYTYRGKYLKDFTIMLLKQSEIFLQNHIKQSQSSAWFQSLDKDGKRNYIRKTKRFVYRFLYQMLSTLFATLKDSISLSSTQLEEKYPSLLEMHKKTQNFTVKEIASRTIFAEDIFYVGCTKLGSLNGDCRPGSLIGAIFHTDVLNAIGEKNVKKALSAIQENIGMILNKETMQELHVMVEQFFDPNNRLRKFPRDIASSSLHHASITDRIRSAINILKRQRVSKEQFKSVLENEINSNSNEDIRETLDKLTTSSTDVLQFLNIPISALTPSNNLFCGFLNLVMHAIRLLYTTEYMGPRSKYHLSTLKFLKNLVGENLSYEESLTYLCIESFSAEELSPGDLVRILCERQLSKKVFEVGLIDMSSIASYQDLQDSIGDLFTAASLNSDCRIFAVHFKGQSEGFKGPVPFSFYYDCDRKSKSLASFRWVLPDSTKEAEQIDLTSPELPRFDLQCFGGIYFSAIINSYKFAFLSYSLDSYNGRFSQFILDNNSRLKTINNSLLSIKLDASYRLVSLILIKRGDSSSRFDDPLTLVNNTYGFEIQGFQHQCYAKYAQINERVLASCADRNKWLTSDSMNALVIKINQYFGEFNDQTRNIFFDTYCFVDFESKKQHLEPFLADMNKLTSVMHFPINIDNVHWVYSFISVEHETIFLMDSIAPSIDSFNSSVQTRMVEFANTIITHSSNVFKPVYHTSPPQCDGVSCGVFTILNILKVSKAVHDGELETFLADQEWGKKHFSDSVKAEIRSNFVDIMRSTKTVDVLFKYLN